MSAELTAFLAAFASGVSGPKFEGPAAEGVGLVPAVIAINRYPGMRGYNLRLRLIEPSIRFIAFIFIDSRCCQSRLHK